MLSLLVIILSAAILIFFAKEFGNLIKKILAIKGLKLFLPLMLASLVVIRYETWILWALIYLKLSLQFLILSISSWLPFRGNQAIATMLLLLLLTILPMCLLALINQRRAHYLRITYWPLGVCIWLLLTITTTVSLY